MMRILSRCFVTGLVLVFALSLSGCGSKSGQGEADPEKPLVLQTFSENCSLCHDSGSVADVEEVHRTATNSLAGEITGVTIVGGTVTVYFRLFDSENPLIPLASVAASSIRFTIAQLVPGAGGDASYWQSYINTEATKEPGDPGPMPDGTTEVQATYERANTTGGTFTDNGDGTYSYEFSFDITSVDPPVTYDPALTHRIAMQVSDNVDNAIYDFRPDGAPVITTRDIAMNASCNECHVKLGFHGGDRIAVEYCVTCHNPGSADPNSGNTVDMTVMIHKIHMGEDLPSVEAGGEYAIWGYYDSKHDYSDVAHPQDIRNCTKCHDAADTPTPDGDNWKDVPTMEACGSCHDDVDFAAGTGHTVQTDNSACATCHPATGTPTTGKNVVEAHEIAAQVASANFKYNILDVSTSAGTGGALNVTIEFSITDPQNGDLEYDIFDGTTANLTRPSFLIGWDTTDYTNTGSGATPAQPVSVSVSDATEIGTSNTFTLTVSDAVPAGVTGSGVVALQGYVYKDLDGDGQIDDRVPVKSVVKAFAITDTTAQSRREVVDIDNCNKCHESLSLHGNNRTDEIQVCVICHNANATDIEVRPADSTTAADGKAEETVDMKYMIHAIHAGDKDLHGFRENGIVVYGYGNREHDFSHVRFPGILNNCEACHDSGTYGIPLDESVQTTTVKTGSDLADPNDDKNVTPAAAVCSSCHDDILSKSHMAEEGGVFDFKLYKPEEETTDTGGPSGTQPPGHTDRTDCFTCHS